MSDVIIVVWKCQDLENVICRLIVTSKILRTHWKHGSHFKDLEKKVKKHYDVNIKIYL